MQLYETVHSLIEGEGLCPRFLVFDCTGFLAGFLQGELGILAQLNPAIPTLHDEGLGQLANANAEPLCLVAPEVGPTLCLQSPYRKVSEWNIGHVLGTPMLG